MIFCPKNKAIALLCCLLFSISACENPPQKSTASKQSSQKLPTITIAVTGAPANWLTILAFEKGFFKKAGLDATPKYFPSGKRALLGMFAGDVDIATTADVPIVKNSLERNDFAILATIGTTYNDNKVIARNDHGIVSPEDLRNKQVATQSSSAAHFFLHLFLLKNNLSKTDIIPSFAKIEELPAMLCNGKAEAIVTRQPFIRKAQEQCGNKIIIFEEPGLFVKNFHLTAFKDFINLNQLSIQKMLQAMLEAEQFMRNHKDEAVSLLAHELGLLDNQVRLTIEEIDLAVSLNQPSLRILADETRWLTDVKSLDKEVPNFLDFIWMDGLKTVRPEAVTIIY